MTQDAVKLFGLIIEGRRHLLKVARTPEKELRATLARDVRMELDHFSAPDPVRYLWGSSRGFQFEVPLYNAWNTVATEQLTVQGQNFWVEPSNSQVLRIARADPRAKLEQHSTSRFTRSHENEDGVRLAIFLAFARLEGVALLRN
jgi:hypothetical protein